GIFLGIDERDDSSRRNAIEDRSAFAQRTHLDFLHFETPVAFAIHYFLAIVFKDGFAGNGNRARKIVPQDAKPDGEARAEARIGLVELDSHIDKTDARSEEHTSELQSRENLVCRLLLEKKK